MVRCETERTAVCRVLCGCLVPALLAVSVVSAAEESPARQGSILAADNLVAWCIVPFDAAKRGPAERAAMLRRLGLRKVAYDWRAEHVPTFEQEILAYQQNGLEFFAFWGEHEEAFRLFEKYNLRPQIWKTLRGLKEGTDEQKVEAAAKQLLPLVERTRKLGCKLGLYNHGGWGGEPQNLVAVCRYLREQAHADHVGIVYNFHHAHEHISDFAESLALMQPYLLCLNLNGMNDEAQPKIVSLGKGQHEKQMLQIVLKSGYRGPIGILDHRNELDAEQSLRENLQGLEKLRGELGDR